MVDPREASSLMARRTFLAAGASLALPLPQALARFFSDPLVTDPLARDRITEGRELLRASLASAKSLGKPLLVLIVPATGDTSDDWRLRRERGEDLGGWLDAMDDRELAWLAWCEVGCATTGSPRPTGAIACRTRPHPCCG